LEEVPPEESKWQGECFVFDTRVSIDEAGAGGAAQQCHGCRQPLTPGDINDDAYEPGVSCPRCHGQLSAERRANLRERRRQVELAAARNDLHIGAVMEAADRPGTKQHEP
jgi:UPF0176 protein